MNLQHWIMIEWLNNVLTYQLLICKWVNGERQQHKFPHLFPNKDYLYFPTGHLDWLPHPGHTEMGLWFTVTSQASWHGFPLMLFRDADLSRSTMALSRTKSCMLETGRERTTCHLYFLKKKKYIFYCCFCACSEQRVLTDMHVLEFPVTVG